MIKDLEKYKRIFTFGCSFTSHIYPTYADVLAAECVQASFFNLARPGSGNSLITYKIVEANKRFKFTEHDLVIVMYTSFFREDRYVHTRWECHGNVFNNDFYDEDFVRKYADPNGYAIQNCATITLGNSFIKSLPCDSLLLTAWPFFKNEFHEVLEKKYIDDLRYIYSDLIDSFPISLFDYLFPDCSPPLYYKKGLTYFLDDGSIFNDAHPNPLAHYDYLKNGLRVPLTDRALEYATTETQELKKCETQTSIIKRYQLEKEKNHNKIKSIYY